MIIHYSQLISVSQLFVNNVVKAKTNSFPLSLRLTLCYLIMSHPGTVLLIPFILLSLNTSNSTTVLLSAKSQTALAVLLSIPSASNGMPPIPLWRSIDPCLLQQKNPFPFPLSRLMSFPFFPLISPVLPEPSSSSYCSVGLSILFHPFLSSAFWLTPTSVFSISCYNSSTISSQ